MTTYGAAWRNAALIVGGVGVMVALLGDDVLVRLTVAGSVGFTAGVFAYLVQEARADPRHELQALVVAALVTGGGFGVTGLAALDGDLAVLLVALFAVASPPAVAGCGSALRRLTRRPRRTARTVPSPETPATPTAGAVERVTEDRLASTLTDPELCAAWPASSDALDRAREHQDTVQQARLVALRQSYLDELERRDPEGFRCWLATSADPTSDPSTFLAGALDPSRGHEDEPPRA